MGLAPYGNRDDTRFKKFKKIILEELVDIRDDGSILLNLKYFDYPTGLRMCSDRKWQALFGVPRRKPETELTGPYMDLALAIQEVTEEIILRLARTTKDLTGCNNLVMAGGVALNCVANGKLLRERTYDNIWIQPAAGDAGGALGAAYATRYIWQGAARTGNNNSTDAMQGAYLGPAFDDRDVQRLNRKFEANCRHYENFGKLCKDTAALLADGNVVGWFQGRLELGPRALGNRSILGDPRHPQMQKRLNIKIKYREGFRPFAPSVLAEDTEKYFQLDQSSPYMLLVAPVQNNIRKPLPENYESLDLYDRLYHLRSDIPAVTHVDYSARIQTVHKETNERYWQLIRTFKELTNCGVIVNTSFNVRGEPIVCTPEDAYTCFMRTDMDYLVIGDFLFVKTEQPEWKEESDWRKKYALD
jgi:carbamoyltransferase